MYFDKRLCSYIVVFTSAELPEVHRIVIKNTNQSTLIKIPVWGRVQISFITLAVMHRRK